MIDYKEHFLDNGLHVIIHEDKTTPLAVVNTLYKVGSRNENPNKTGFAHLFEHLMFGGSANIPTFDTPLQKVGGDNNAFTNTDITNYYVTLPASNIETAFWLESDRMNQLSFNPKTLEVQQKVVIEEFKQRYLNQPYGDVWLKLRPVAYQHHPYQWPTIGKEISHIENATMEDVQNFFYSYYAPNNAILVVAGNVNFEKTIQMIEKWYGDIPKREIPDAPLPIEPIQTEARVIEIEAQVPLDAIYKAYKSPKRNSREYYITDLLSDILGRGKSSRLYEKLVKEEKVFNSISSYVNGAFDPGLLVISGKLNDGFSTQQGDEKIKETINELLANINEGELEKVKNQAETTLLFNEAELLNRAMGLAIASALGNTDLINEELGIINSINMEDISQIASTLLQENQCSTLYYKSKK